MRRISPQFHQFRTVLNEQHLHFLWIVANTTSCAKWFQLVAYFVCIYRFEMMKTKF